MYQVTSGLASKRIVTMLTKCMPQTATVEKHSAALNSRRWFRHPCEDVRRPRSSKLAYEPRIETTMDETIAPGRGWRGIAWTIYQVASPWGSAFQRDYASDVPFHIWGGGPEGKPIGNIPGGGGKVEFEPGGPIGKVELGGASIFNDYLAILINTVKQSRSK